MSWRDYCCAKALLRPLPWWMVMLFLFLSLMKLQLTYVGSACAVLGINEQLDSSVIKKKFRQISMCTHPDRLRGRLKRAPTDAETRRGEVLFNRASASKDELQEMWNRATAKKTKKYKKNGKWVTEVLNADQPDPVIYCREKSSAEVAIRKTVKEGYREVKEYLAVYGISSITESLGSSITDYIWGLVQFQQGLFGTIMSLFWLSFCYKMIRNFVSWVWGMGFSAPFHLTQVFLFAPIPTLLRFFYLPAMRIFVSLEDYASFEQFPASPPTSEDERAAVGHEMDAASSTMSTARAKVSADDPSIRRRKRLKPGEEEQRRLTKEEAVQKLLSRKHTGESDDSDEIRELSSMSARELVSRSLKGREQISRAVGAKNIQVELLVILSKPILPLIMVVSLGQVINGLFASVFMWEAYRRIPTFFYEYHHVICMVFGFIHTWIGVTAGDVERQAEQDAVQRLLWEWNYRDCILIIFLCMVGTDNAVYSSLGNEPSYTSSFASGVALRILFETDFIRNLFVTQWVQNFITGKLYEYGIAVTTADEQMVFGGGGVGDCGGGMFEMFFGEDVSWIAAAIVQCALCVLPLLYATMWLQRGIKGATSARGSKAVYTRRFPRIVARIVLGVAGVAQVLLCLMVSLNASHGGLYNFWLSLLVGVWMESMMTTYDIRGPVRSLLFLLVFCFV